MRKLLLLICALLTSVSGAWAIDVKVIRSNKAPDTFGSLASTTFTTNSASGLAGVTIAGITTTKPTNFSYGACLGVESSSSGTITMTAPTGYYIYGYSLTARSNTSSVSYTLTPSAGGSAKTTSTGGVTLTASGLSSQTASFTYSASSANSFYIPSMTIIIIADGATVIDVTYTLNYEGVTRGTSTIKQGVGEAAVIPEAIDNGYMTYSYSPSTIATSSTTAVTATATWDGPFQIGDAFNTIPRWYRVRLNSNNNFYMYNNAGTLSFNDGSFDKTSKDYLWGFVGNPYDGFQIYNYNLGSSKAIDMAVPCTLSADGTSSTFKIAQGKAGSTSSTADSYFALYDPTHSNYLNYQGGAIKRWGVDEGSTFLINAVKVVTFEDGNGDPCAVAVDGGSAVSTIYVATNGNDSFTLPDANLYSLDGGTSWKTNTEAVNAIKAAGTDDISVTVAPAITVTYYLKWNSSTIKTQASVKTPQGFSPSVTVPWNAPAFCEFSYDVATIGESTTEVNVTMTWDGPFDISSDFNSAKWYYLKVNGKWAVYGNFTYNSKLITQPYDDETNAQNTIAKSMWAFVGNPYDGFEIINRHAGSGMYLNSQSGTAMYMSNSNEFTTFKIAQKEGNTFSMNNGGFYINCGDSYIAANSGVSENATSSLTVEDIPYKFLALAYLPEYAASHHMGQYFGVDESSYNSMMTTITNAASITENDYNSLVSNINVQLSPRLPETGYYRIKSSGSRGDQSYITYGYLDGSKGTGLLTTIGNKETDLGTVVKLTRVGTSKNYIISIQGLNVQAHSGDNTLFRATGAEGLNFQFNHINFSGMCSIYDGTNHGNMHEADWKKPDTGLNGVVGWDAGDGTNASSWCLEDASTIEVTLNNGGDGFYYATCFTDFPVSYTGASNGEGLFVLTGGESNGKVTAQKVAAVPAQQGFLIRLAAENVTDSKVTLTIPASAEALTGTNVLTGTCLATTKPDGNVYVFSKVGDDLGFFPYTGSDIPANRAYIVEPAGSGTRSFILSFDETTGLNGVSTSTPAGTIFDMQGRRVNKAEKGLYIVNGKKVLF